MSENLRDAPWRWLATLYFCGTVIAAVTGRFSFLMLAVGAAGLVLFAPPAQSLTRQKWNFAVKDWRLIPMFLVLAFAVTKISKYQTEAAEREQAQQKQEAIAAALLAEQQYFKQNKTIVLARIGQLVKDGKFDEANTLGSRFLKVLKDDDLQAAVNKAMEAGLLAKFKVGRYMTSMEQAPLYEALAKLDPVNHTYREMAAFHAKGAKEELAEGAAAMAAAERQRARVAMLEKQFSPWDGSHKKLEAAVKQSMKNPASYEHIATRYTDLGQGMKIRMTFRGTNSFGGVVPNTVIATVSDDGEVVSMSTL